MALQKSEKERLGHLLGLGHARYGAVAPRRPYHDDDEGGAGSSELRMPEHPLLNQRPVGAASDLTMVVNENRDTMEAAKERAAEAGPELQKQPVLQKALAATYGHSFNPKPTR